MYEQMQPPQEKKSHLWIWILIFIVLIAVGIGLYFWFSGGNTTPAIEVGKSSIPQPPALP